MIFSLLLSQILSLVCLLIAIAYYTLAERKVMASIQRRKGPNVVGFWGLLQPLADGLKAITKELLIPRNSSKFLFLFASFLMLVLSLFNWIFIPFNFINLPINIINIKDVQYSETLSNVLIQYDINKYINLKCTLENNIISLLYVFSISSLNIYGIILAGWSSNSKYAFLGALRSAAQMISYEVSLGLLIIPIIMVTGSLNLAEIVKAQQTIWFIIPFFPIAILFFISCLAETNRTPFDLPEAEAELVAGYNVEYSSITFAMFFLGEYSNMLLMSAIFSCLFLGGWIFCGNVSLFLYCIKIIICAVMFIIIRAILPRYRYDQLLYLGWKLILPLILSFIIIVISLF